MIKLEVTGDLWIATLVRPEKANALTLEMLRELADIARRAQDAKALILTGEGKAFSAGMDLKAAKDGLATDPVWEELSSALAALPGFTIAALNGTVAGGAMGMVLACDLRVASPQAKVFYPVMKLGFLPQPSDPGRLAGLVGPARARLILMGGAKLAAEEAERYGLFDRISSTPLETALELAQDVLGADRSHGTAIKQMISAGDRMKP
ncbi:MAG: enoyl-CoA hydratase/isomerase family protein [Pseudomonadota bacterium]